MTAVRPFPARVVRPERAAEAVTPLIDPVDEHAEALHPGGVDPTAYDDAGTAFFVYRQQRGRESHTAVVCDVHPVAFVDGRVRGHEAVRPDRVAALLEHFATGPERPALAALLHQPGPAYAEATGQALDSEPLLDVDGPDGLRQTVWRVPEGEASDRLAAELSATTLYVADGHHRVAATLGQWRSGSSPDDAGLLCAVYPLDGLRLEAFHRRVTGPVDPVEVREVLERAFDVREVEAPPGQAPGRFGLYAARTWWEATFTGDRSGAAELDVSVLAEHVLEPLAGAATGRSVEVAASSIPLSVLTARCDADGGLLVTLAPPPLEVLTDLADRGRVMPPKTTFFEPKPCAGIFLRG